MNIKDLNVDGVYEFVEGKFGHHVASNFKGKNYFIILKINYISCCLLLKKTDTLENL